MTGGPKTVAVTEAILHLKLWPPEWRGVRGEGGKRNQGKGLKSRDMWTRRRSARGVTSKAARNAILASSSPARVQPPQSVHI